MILVLIYHTGCAILGLSHKHKEKIEVILFLTSERYVNGRQHKMCGHPGAKTHRNFSPRFEAEPLPVAARVWGIDIDRWHRGLESNLRHGCLSSSFFCVVLSCVGRGLCDRLVTRPKESYWVSKWIKKPLYVRRPRSIQELYSHRWGGGGFKAEISCTLYLIIWLLPPRNHTAVPFQVQSFNDVQEKFWCLFWEPIQWLCGRQSGSTHSCHCPVKD
jgi:hypothetical protein